MASTAAEASESHSASAVHHHRGRWDGVESGGNGGGGASPGSLTGKGFGTLSGGRAGEIAPALAPSQAYPSGARWYGSMPDHFEGSSGVTPSAGVAVTEGAAVGSSSREGRQEGEASAEGVDRQGDRSIFDWGEARDRYGGGGFHGVEMGGSRDGRGGRDIAEDARSDDSSRASVGGGGWDSEARHGRDRDRDRGDWGGDRGRSRDPDGEPPHFQRGDVSSSMIRRERSGSELYSMRFDPRASVAYRLPDGVGMVGRMARKGMIGGRWMHGMRGGGRAGRWISSGGNAGGRGGHYGSSPNYADLAVRPGGGRGGGGGMAAFGFGGSALGGGGYADLAASRGGDDRRRNSGDDERRRSGGLSGSCGGSGSGDDDDRRRRSHSGGSATSGRRSSGLTLSGRNSLSPGAVSDRRCSYSATDAAAGAAGGVSSSREGGGKGGNRSPYGTQGPEDIAGGDSWRSRDRDRRGERDRYELLCSFWLGLWENVDGRLDGRLGFYYLPWRDVMFCKSLAHLRL